VDRVGPLLLGFAVLVGIVVLLKFFLQSDQFNWGNKNQAGLQEQVGACFRHPIEDFNSLLNQPSDVVVDMERQVLLVPSLSEIRAVPLTGGDAASTVVANIPGADIEGLAYGSDKNVMYAINELNQNDQTELIAMQWDNDRLEVTARWEIPTLNAEGIAYVNGKLYIGGDNSSPTISGEMAVYEEPELTNDVTELIGKPVNGRLLAHGLSDAKIAALHYFEGLLYVLHDNERLVRAWDIERGILQAEWKLPMVNDGYEKMWEGLALQRIQSNSNLRGGAPTWSLILHLALDTPAEVWSLSVTEGSTAGSIILPSCAAA